MKVLSFCFLLSFWTFGQIFSSVLPLPYRSSWFFLDHGSLLRISMFPCFQFCEKREFWPHTRDSKPWKLEQNIYALPTELAGLEQTHVTLFFVSNLNCIASFFDSYAFAALRDSFCVTLLVSEFLCFAASSFLKKVYFSPHKGLEPLTVGLKVQRSTELPISTRWKFCPFVSCCHFERSAKFFRVFCFYLTVHRDSFLITVVYSEFLCFLAFSSVKKGNLATHKRLKPLKIGIKYLRSADWASGAQKNAFHIVSCR